MCGGTGRPRRDGVAAGGVPAGGGHALIDLLFRLFGLRAQHGGIPIFVFSTFRTRLDRRVPVLWLVVAKKYEIYTFGEHGLLFLRLRFIVIRIFLFFFGRPHPPHWPLCLSNDVIAALPFSWLTNFRIEAAEVGMNGHLKTMRTSCVLASTRRSPRRPVPPSPPHPLIVFETR